jgi:hypothetical protein
MESCPDRSRGLRAIGAAGAIALALLNPAAAAGQSVGTRAATHLFPRLALQLQLCCRTSETQAIFDQASWWDLAVVDSEAVGAMADYLGPDGKIRRANPNAILVAYFSPADYVEDLELPLYRRFRSGFDTAWLLRDADGRTVPLYELAPGKWTQAINPTSAAQRAIPEFLNRHVVATGLVDGIFYDWAATSMSWLNKRKNVTSARVDVDGDGIGDPDEVLDATWRRGYAAMLAHSRHAFPASAVIVGNAGWITGPDYDGLLNGVMIEQFLEGEARAPGFAWTPVMRSYAHYARHAVAPRLSIVMANRDDAEDTAFMRFALASALMFDGYFAFTNRTLPTSAYQAARWYDEFAVDRATGQARRDRSSKGYLGSPLGEASAVGTGVLLADALARGEPAHREVWQRDFEHGRVLVNPSRVSREVDLERPFRRIRGSSDRTLNDGSLVRSVELAPRTGVILLRAEPESGKPL